jgi:hypothetical protein
VSDLHGRPTAAELLDAVVGYLRDDLAPGLDPGSRHQVRIAVHALEIVAREMALGPAQAEDHAARLAELGVASDAELAEAIRVGARPDGPRLREILAADTADRLRVANPGWLPPPGAENGQ